MKRKNERALNCFLTKEYFRKMMMRLKEAESLSQGNNKTRLSVELREKAGVGNFNRLDIFRLS